MKKITIQNEEEDQQITFIYRRARLKYRISEDNLEKKEIISLLNIIPNLTAEEDENKSNLLHKLFEKTKKESSKLNILFLAKETINRLNGHINDDLTSFFDSFYLSLLTKSESLVFRLKQLRMCNWVTKTDHFSSTIDYILTTITEGDLYDLDNEEISKHVTAKVYRNQELGPLVQYSQIETKNQRERDVTFIRSNTRKYTNPFNQSGESSMRGLLKKRRSTNLSTIVSPSIIARLYTQLSKIDQTDFNIFDLDEIIGKKTTIFIAKEILSKCDVVEQEMISPEILNNFITEIVEYYDRVNAIYHNDLHAGDVMQTLYTMLVKGNLLEVSHLKYNHIE